MAKLSYELDEKDIELAIAYWLRNGLPVEPPRYKVHINVQSLGPHNGDPREPRGPTITARATELD